MLDIDIALIPQYYPRSKRESARLPMTCALGHLLGTYPQRFHPNPSISQAAREWPRASAAASPMGAPKVRLARSAVLAPRTSCPRPTAVTNHRTT